MCFSVEFAEATWTDEMLIADRDRFLKLANERQWQRGFAIVERINAILEKRTADAAAGVPESERERELVLV